MKTSFFIVLFFLSFSVIAQEDDKHTEASKAADDATNPLAFVTKLQFQPNYTFKDNGGDQFVLISRIMQPSKTIGLPFIKSKDPSKIYTIYRLEAPIGSQTFPNNNGDATGLTDFVFIDVIAFKKSWGIMGIGPAIILPTASSDALGSGKWSAGPVATILYKKKKGWTFGVLAQQFNSFAGDSDRQDVNRMLFQPIVTRIFKKGYFANFSPIMVFDWENDSYNIPIGFNVGRAFAKNLSMFIGPEYVVSGPNQGDFTIRLNINAMFAATK